MDQEVAVGSVGHILVQTFKSLFPEHHGKDGEEGEEVPAAGSEVAASETGEPAGEGEGEGGEAGAEGEEADSTPAEPEGGEEGGKEGDGEGEGEEGEEKAAVPEPEPEPEEEAEPVDPAVLEQQRLDKEILAIAQQRAVEQIKDIDQQLKSTQQQSYKLATFLRERQKESRVADTEDAQNLRSWGLVQGSEMPIGPSNLSIEDEVLQSFGRYGQHLIVPRKLMESVEREMLEKTGNLQKEAMAEIPSFSSMKGDPHYLKQTHAYAVRAAVMQDERDARATRLRLPKKKSKKGRTKRGPETEGDSSSSSPSSRASSGSRSPSKRKPKKGGKKQGQHEGLNAEQLDLEAKVLQRMQHKLNFLKNPRHTKQRGMAGVPNAVGLNTGGSITSTLAGKASIKAAYQRDVFDVVPPEAQFTEYEANEQFTTTLLVRNCSTLSRHVRILPPTTRFFSMDVVEFPAEGGAIAPGMSAKVRINFLPNSLADFSDEITVITEQKRFTVPLRAFRTPPLLSLPLTMDAGNCMLGDRLDTTFTCTNTGGAGRFRLFPAEEWPSPAAVYTHTQIDIAPFTLWPAEFSLQPGDSMPFNLRFLPTDVGRFERSFVMVCDNCEVTTFRVVGESCNLSVVVTDIAGTALPEVAAPALPGEVQAPGTARSQYSTKSGVSGVGSVADAPAAAQAGGVTFQPSAGSVGTPAKPSSVPVLALGGSQAQAAQQQLAVDTAQQQEAVATRPPLRVRFDPVTPGLMVSKTFSVKNFTPVTLPYSWAISEFPAVPPFSKVRGKRSAGQGASGASVAGSVAPTSRTSKLASGTARSSLPGATERSTATQATNALGDSSAAAAGAQVAGAADAASCFTIQPETGHMAPYETCSFTVTFNPAQVYLYEVVARMMIAGVPLDPRKEKPHKHREAEDGEEEKLSPVHEGKRAEVGSVAASEAKSSVGQQQQQGGEEQQEQEQGLGLSQQAGEGTAGGSSPTARPSTPAIQRHTVCGTNVFLQGVGREADVLLRPQLINVPGSLTLGAHAVQRVRLVNYGDSTVSFTWQPPRDGSGNVQPELGAGGEGDGEGQEQQEQQGETGGGALATSSLVPKLDVPPPVGLEGSSSVAVGAFASVAAHPSSGQLAPGAAVDVEVSFTATAVGRHSFELPCSIQHGPRGGVSLRVNADVVGPRVSILEPEVDFGLVSVGGISERVVKFRNLSDAPAAWVFKQTSKEFMAPQTPQSIRTPVAGGPLTARSGASGFSASVGGPGSVVGSVVGGASSLLSPAAKAATAQAAGGEANDKVASLRFHPSSGVLPPGGESQVTVTCAAGSEPQRLREMFQCVVQHGNTAYARGRGEVQSPKVYLDTLSMPLNTTFVDVPVTRVVKLVNLSNLDAGFKWDNKINAGENKAFHIAFSPSHGTLGPKAVQEVRVTVTPCRPGRVDEVLICDIRGMPMPLGFVMTTTVKALVVAYSVNGDFSKEAVPGDGAKAELTDEEKAAAKAAAAEEAAKAKAEEEAVAQLTDPALIAEAGAMKEAAAVGAEVGVLPSMNFGASFQTFSSRSITLRIHNLSGIPTTFDVDVRNYRAEFSMAELEEEKARDAATTRAESRASMNRTKAERQAGVASRLGSRGGSKSKLPVPPPQPPAGGSSRLTARSRMSGRSSKSTKSLLQFKRLATATSLGSTAVRKRLLDRNHEDVDKFQSEAGATMLADRKYKEVMRKMLALKRGVAFDVVPRTGELPAWGIVEVKVTCVGDMPGQYRDELVVAVDGLPDSRLPVKVGVVGTPLQFMANVVGMLLFKSPPMLTFGEVVRGTASVKKVFKIKNTSPMHADVLWKMRPDFDSEPPVVTVGLKAVAGLDSAAPVQLQIIPYSDDASPPPFKITPETGRVPAHGTASFTIEANPENPPSANGDPTEGPCFARFVADATWVKVGGGAASAVGEGSSVSVVELPDASASTLSAGKASEEGEGKGDGEGEEGEGKGEDGEDSKPADASFSPGCLTLRTHITPVLPYLHVDKRTPGGKRGKRLPFIKFGVWSTVPASHPSYTKQITLTNDIPSALTFTIAVDGPFTILNARSHAPKHPLSGREGDVVNRPMSAGSTRMFTLPHLSNIVLDIQFDSQVAMSEFRPVASILDERMSERKDGLDAERAQQAKRSAKGPLAHLARTPATEEQGAKLKAEYRGAVVVTFSNGTVQKVGLRGVVLRPMLVAAPPVVELGHVHVESYKVGSLHVANPTKVEAEWRLAHLAVPPPKPRVRIDAKALGLSTGADGTFSMAALGLTEKPATPREKPTDDPSVFSFSVRQGVLAGPTAPLTVAGVHELRHSGGKEPLLKIDVTFKPKENILYRSRFRLHVRKGEGFDVVVSGHGSYEEVH